MVQTKQRLKENDETTELEKIKPQFDWQFYTSYYSDLHKFNTSILAWFHFRKMGYNQGRIWCKSMAPVLNPTSKNPNMILILRGHIRNSFETKKLYNLVKNIHIIFPDLKIFIHTWNIFASNISWRKITVNEQNVTDKIIYDYFDDLKHLIKKIIIDDDSKINLIGNLCGNINNSLMPIIGWKNYWYGKYKIIDYLYNMNIDENEMIVNCRFDVMNNSNSFDEVRIINFIKNNSKIIFTKNIFLFDDEGHNGIDNIYIGNINTLYKLISKFFYELDDILIKDNDTKYQERLVYRINNILFD
jgi:hypothetical protein